MVVELPAGAQAGFQPYGGGLRLWKCKAPEVIISGPAETGKTRTALEKLDVFMWKYPGSQAIIVRKTYKSLKTSVLLTFERKVLGAWNPAANNGAGAFDQSKTPVVKLGGEHVEGYLYPNGSRIFLGGMDSPDKVLSSEWDVVYVNQAEELTLNDWEIISTRTTGRAGNMPYAQMMADCNPSFPTHWIRARTATGRLKFIESRHEDNPTLFNQVTHEITEQGKRTMAVLDALTGVRKLRLRHGKWAAAEGAVYEEFDRTVHLIPSFPIPDDWVRIRVIDFGYTNPFVCQWWAMDEDRRLYLYREIYMSHRIVGGDPFGNDHASQINELSLGEDIYATVADHDAEDRATLEAHGIPTEPAMKSVSLGIQAVQARLRKAGDGRPRLFVFEDALVDVDQVMRDAHKPICTAEEFDSYIWKPTRDGVTNKEDPLKVDDHGMDTTRYLVCFVDGITLASKTTEDSMVYEENYEISPY
jgi:phage terminase large subunit